MNGWDMFKEEKKTLLRKIIIDIIVAIFTIYAIYLSHTCNKGFNLLGVTGAYFGGPLYIIYKLLVGCNKVKI